MIESTISLIRDIYRTNEPIPLHAPTFSGTEREYVLNAIDSTYVSSAGKFVDAFEGEVEDYTGATKAISTVNGTAALHTALYVAGVVAGDLVITQALTFVATCNALYHMGVEPVFVDVSELSLGLCPKAVESFLQENAVLDESNTCIHIATGKRIKAVVPMHTFGHPVDLDEFVSLCARWNLVLVEDAAESLGSFYRGQHTGTIGEFGALSFNGNKIITTGGGGMVLCRREEDGAHAKHVTTTAKVAHPFEFFHDEPGFNYRMPNINAALGCAQIEVLHSYLYLKRELAGKYKDFFEGTEFKFVSEPDYAKSNYWLNAIVCPDAKSRDLMLSKTNDVGVMTRPIWKLMHRLPMFEKSIRADLSVSEKIEARLVNLPSSPVVGYGSN